MSFSINTASLATRSKLERGKSSTRRKKKIIIQN
jgi:hypothetical protein